MYYEERLIDGVAYVRYTLNGNWIEKSKTGYQPKNGKVFSVDLPYVNASLPDLVRNKVIAEIEREYGKFSELEEERKDNFYLMLGIIDNALKQ